MSVRVKRDCSRPSCTRRNWIGDLCEVHWEHMRRAGLAGLIDPAPARIHLIRLHAAEFTNRDISTLSDVSLTCIKRQSAHIPKRIRAAESRRILAVPLDAELPHRTNFTVDGTGFMRRVQAMCRMGWSVPLIAAEAGVNKRAIYDAMSNGVVSRPLLKAIKAVYADLGFRPGPSKQAATKAQLKGWVTAMAWDNIDDPSETPKVDALAVEVVDVVAVQRVVDGHAKPSSLTLPERYAAAKVMIAYGAALSTAVTKLGLNRRDAAELTERLAA